MYVTINKAFFQAFFDFFFSIIPIKYIFYSTDFIFFTFFSTSLRAIIIWCPQPMHFKRKSAPTRRTSHSLLPQGCCFFNFTISPISYTVTVFLLFLTPKKQSPNCFQGHNFKSQSGKRRFLNLPESTDLLFCPLAWRFY